MLREKAGICMKGKRTSFLSVLTVLLLAFSTFSAENRKRIQTGNLQKESIQHGGIERTYHIYKPASLKGRKNVPLLIVLHGGGGSGRKMPNLTFGRFKELSEMETFILLCPDGVDKHWNDGRDVNTRHHNIDDVGFLSKLIDLLVSEGAINPKRVYMCGISNGGMMTYRMALECSDKLAAIGTVSSAMPEFLAHKKPSRPVPLLIISSPKDPFVPWKGGYAGFRLWKYGRFHRRGRVVSQADTLAYWLKQNRAETKAHATILPDSFPDDGTNVVMERYPPKNGGAEIIRYIIKGGGHTWPGGKQYMSEKVIGKTCRDINACDVLWRFFKNHSLNLENSNRKTPVADYDKTGPYKTNVKEFPDLTDEKRENRRVPIKVISPVADGPFPLVIFSHGGMGNWNSNIYQAKHLASHGYIVFCVQHVFSDNIITRKYVREAKGSLKERIWKALTRMTVDPRAVLGRPRDISFAIDKAMEWNRSETQFAGKINTSKIAVAGHSYGAATVLTVCGAQPTLDHLKPTLAPGRGLAGDYSDSRVTLGIAMSPQGPGTSRFSKESYKSINKPLLCFSGDGDEQLGADGSIQSAEKRLEGFKLMPQGNKYMLWLANADHLSFSDNPSAWRFPSKARADAQRITKAMMLVFCDYYLKGDEEAKKYMNSDYAGTLTGNIVTKLTWYQK
ncbi:MAG: hypothetical protein GXP32_04370 [Kiritimatiellaeota bacterium]|nr:hypothetical protein [Kiritimatiellota bacterium]